MSETLYYMIELTAISRDDPEQFDVCYIDTHSIVAVYPDFMSRNYSLICLTSGHELLVRETPREVIAKMREVGER